MTLRLILGLLALAGILLLIITARGGQEAAPVWLRRGLIAGVGGLMIALLALALFNDQSPAGSTYVPAHFEDGTFVPARMIPPQDP
ncbi:MAG: DUF6111 family protein [Pseudomonadota bacterium]